jgi:hypothetical protein
MGAAGQNQIPITFGSGADGDPSSTVRDKAADDETKANLLRAMADANVIYDQDGSYSGASNTRLAGIDPSLQWQATAASTGPNVMSWKTASFPSSSFGVAALSNTGLCFLLVVTDETIVLYGWTFTVVNCTGTYALAAATAQAWDY